MSNEIFYLIFTPIVIILFVFAGVIEYQTNKIKKKTVDDYLKNK